MGKKIYPCGSFERNGLYDNGTFKMYVSKITVNNNRRAVVTLSGGTYFISPHSNEFCWQSYVENDTRVGRITRDMNGSFYITDINLGGASFDIDFETGNPTLVWG